MHGFYTTTLNQVHTILHKNDYVIVKIVTHCFHRPSFLSYIVLSGIVYCTENIRALITVVIV